MFSYVTTAGKAAIQQARDTTDKISFTRYQLGNLALTLPNLYEEEYDFNLTDFPNLVDDAYILNAFTSYYEGDTDQMTYLPTLPNKVVLKCTTPPEEQATYQYNAVLIFAEIDGEENLFCVSYSRVYNPKFSFEVSEGGVKHYFMLVLQVVNRDDKFDFTNLVLESPEFDEEADFYTLDSPFVKEKDQFILTNHPGIRFNTTRHFVINTAEQFYGVMIFPYEFSDEEQPFVLSFGDEYYIIPQDGVPDGYQALLDENDDPVMDFKGNEIMVPEA